MMSRGYLLYVILLPLLAPLAAEDPEERIVAEMMEHGAASSSSNGFLLPPSQLHHDQPHPSFLLQQLLLRSGALRSAVEDKDVNDSPDATNSDNQDRGHNMDHPSASSSSNSPDRDNDGDGDDADDKEEEGEEKERVDQAGGADGDETAVVSKRVFCNTFTGCGGKHRDRSRRRQGLERLGKRLIPLLAKRPFCNSFGCYNGKRAAAAAAGQQPEAAAAAAAAALSGLAGLPLVHAVPVSDLSPALRARLLTAAVVDGPQEATSLQLVGKRLFCNGYGGCRGGKRSLFAPWLPRMNDVATGRR